ncbi:MAG: dihydroorotase, dihydroorotase [Candidatus Peregrinibacteria bacterium GW2011_GWF2_43_17]|nr:MAG: dihydroorotase, dihydroorotase [Candidatus Peregrinibacteria bacterium GW2011_GWF2_43_17]HAU40218.1 dihydroorotase [Candidatus Peregrinibacteria bacterium]
MRVFCYQMKVMKKLLLKNGTVVSSKGKLKADVLVEGGKIVKVSAKISDKDAKIIDCKGKFIIPGVIDAHVHLREPGATHKEDFETGSSAALKGGVTTVLDMPNNNPSIDTAERLAAKYKLAKGRMKCGHKFFIAATGDNLVELKKAKDACGVKLFMSKSTGGLVVGDDADLEKIFAFAKGLPLVVHAEDEARIEQRKKEFEGDLSPSVHSLIRDDETVYIAIKKALHLAKKHGTKLHIAHVSTKKEMEALKKFKDKNITAEVATHHLFLNKDAYASHGKRSDSVTYYDCNFVKINPPIRSEEDRLAMWSALKSGLIDIVVTDHAPHTLDEKKKPYLEAPSGVPGLETLLPLMLDAVNHGELSLERMVEAMCEKPAEIFGLVGKGFVKAGYDADLVVVDMSKEGVVGSDGYATKCGWSPYDGWKLVGWPEKVVCGGKVV